MIRGVPVHMAALPINVLALPNRGAGEEAPDPVPHPAPRAQALLSFYMQRPLLISTVGTSLFSALAISALVHEIDKSCKPDLKLWLAIAVGRSIVRLLLRFLLELSYDREANAVRGNMTYFQKLLEMIDVFGLVWFSVGNLLVFNGPQCADETPLVFFASATYIVSVYIYLFGPALLRLCFRTRLPHELAMRTMIRERDAAFLAAIERMVMLDNDTGASHNDGRGGYSISQSTAEFWRAYLRNSCGMKEYKSFAELQAALSDEDKGSCLDISFCSICLEGFEAADLESGGGAAGASSGGSRCDKYDTLSVVDESPPSQPQPPLAEAEPRDGSVDLHPSEQAIADIEVLTSPHTLVCFPCNAKHVFHTPCLLSWLESCMIKHGHSQAVTCPICRQPLSVPLPLGPREAPTQPTGSL